MPKNHQYEMNMTEGSLLPKILRFALPLMLTSILQLLYNAADVVVVGRFAGATALAAVSSTGSLTSLIVNVFMGLSLGASVLVGQAYGAGKHRDVSDITHTTVTLALVCGAVVTVLGVLFAKPVLRWMDTPEEVLELSSLYVSIYFSGSIFNLVFNYGAAVLRAVGDTRRPMYYLTLSGVVNVVLNLIFVVGFHMSVAGVALATIISQALSAALVVICLIRSDGAIHLDLKKLRLHPDKVKGLIKIGLPAGLQSAMFSISNLLIQSSINSFGAAAMAGNGAAANIEGFIGVGMGAFYTASLTFTSQNLGARKKERLGRTIWLCQACALVSGLGLGMIAYLFRVPLLGLYTTEPEVVQMGLIRSDLMLRTCFLFGLQDVFVGGSRGLGNSFRPMIISIMGICVFRIVWVYTAFAAVRTLNVLYLSYPISYLIMVVAQGICYLITKKRVIQRLQAEDALMQA